MKANKRFLAVFVMLYLSMGFAHFVFAEDKPISSTKKQKSIKLKFDDELVKGSAISPDADSVSVRRHFNYKKLIRVRENFTKEMEDGLNDQ